ncbi:MAG: crosslink repair DNA glycosylase YcaQ family protein [Armatimonadota bacterium]|nr:crosslink repair DNA glycosylase YcaQ family protein [Armatimonadota bacterium]
MRGLRPNSGYWANGTSVLPMEDYPLFEPTRQRFRMQWQRDLLELQKVASEVLARLEAEGPLPARAFRSPHRVHGFWDNKSPKTKATSHVLNLLMDIGEVVVYRKDRERYFTLARRAIPAELLRRAESIDPDEANAARLEKYFRAYRIIDLGDTRFGWSRMTMSERMKAIRQRMEAGEMVPLAVEGVRRQYFLLAEDLDRLQEHQRTTTKVPPEGSVQFLPPLDNLLWRRERVADLFRFNYTWEIYMRPEKRRYGYYAMPILMGTV